MDDSIRLPHFIIGGAPRAGTTFLAQALDRHPGLYMAKPFRPEPKVFLIPAHDRGEYLARYGPLFPEASEGRIRGEKTTNYFESAEACARMADALSDVRVLFLLREPVARAYSNYLWTRKNGLETLSFEEAVAREGQRPSPLQAHARPYDYLTRGDYATFAQHYIDAFGRDRVGFFLFEDIERRPEDFLGAVQRFIGVDPLPFDRLNVGQVNSAAEMGPPLDARLAAPLRERMAPLVERLARVTGLDLTPWGYATRRRAA
jgi:Sulfotransferase domain